MGLTPAGMIKGIEAYGRKETWSPNIPLVGVSDVKAGTVNDITTIGVTRQDGLKPLQFRCPVDITTASGDNLKAGVYYTTNQLNSVKFFDLNEKDTTYAFAYIVYYDYRTDTVGILQGAADGLLRVPTLPNNSILIESKIEPKQGDAYTPGETEGANIIYKTHTELKALADNNQLSPGQLYEMTDYATTHEINDSTNTGTTVIHTEAIEPLLLLAVSNSKFHKQVYSKQYPNDIIYYDITNVLCEDGSTPRPGIITYRKDEWENETHFDFRGTKVYDGANNVYVFANSRNPGSSSFYGNKIGINSTYNNYFLFGNDCTSNILGDGCNSNVFGDDCYSNTLGDNCYSNTLGNNCYSNTLGDNCYSNTLGNNCSSNTLGNGCYSNILGNDCKSNTLGDGCYSNILGNNCYSNTFGEYCNSNTFGEYCISNTFGEYCFSNTFENNCYSNILGDTCISTTLGDACYSNVFGDYCYSNVFGDNCDSNTLGYACYLNILGNDCDSNTFGTGCNSIVPDPGNTDNILNTTFENGVSNITYLATATHLYAAYHKTVFLYPDGTKKLRYFDNSGVLQVVDVNA